MGGVVGLKRSSEILRRQKLEMVANRKHFSLSVKVVDGRGAVTSCYEPEGAVLDQLEAADR